MTNTFNPINTKNTQYIIQSNNPNNPNDLMTIPIACTSTLAPEPLPFTATSLITSLLARATLCLFNQTCRS
jgi:hypothetical protein